MPLADPTDPERMNLGNGSVPSSRPFMFGDVFTGVRCSRGGDPSTVMVVTHPCSMRTGAAGNLRELITVATVVDSPQPTFSAARWSGGMYDYLPLFGIRGENDKAAVHLTDLHSAPSGELDAGNRIGALSDYGITVLLQRWIYQMSRDPVALPELVALIAPILAEVEIQEDWCEAALRSRHGEDPAVVIVEASARIQEVLGPPREGSLRLGLASVSERTSVRRRVAELRKEELGS